MCNIICAFQMRKGVTTKDAYNNVVNEYSNEFDISEIEETYLDYTLDEYIVHETSHFLDSDLCSFCLLRITRGQ